MRWAVLSSNVVTKIIDGEYPEQESRVTGNNIVDVTDQNCQVGWILDGNKLGPKVEIIPDVTPRQFRQALVISGISSQSIVDIINMQAEPLKSLALIEWEYSTAFKRNNPLVTQMAPYLGFTSEMLDNLWKLAATL